MVDPITLEVIQERLISIVREMRATLAHVAHSSVLYEARDFSCIIMNGKGEAVAQSADNPGHIIPLPVSVRAAIERFGDDINPGDVIIINDPYSGGTHLNDVAIIVPVFVGDELVMFPAIRAHWADVGGMTPGSLSGTATEIFQEGVRIPPTKIYDRGEPVTGVMDIMFANMRIEDERRGDLQAMIETCRTAEARIHELVDKFSLAVLNESTALLLDRTEARMRRLIGQIPNGSYVFEDYLDSSGNSDDPVILHTCLTVADGNIAVDFEGTSAQVQGPINASLAVTTTAVFCILKTVLDPDNPINHGSFRPITVTAPHGSILNARFPAPCGGFAEIRRRTQSVVMGALARALPNAIAGDVKGSANHCYVGGYDRKNDKHFIFYEYPAGGTGGYLERNGSSAFRSFDEGDFSSIQPVESIENEYPIVIDSTVLRVDSGGAGLHRGGLGITREVRLLADEARFSTLSDRCLLPPFGLHRAAAGAPNSFTYRRDGLESQPGAVPGKATGFKLRAGDVVIMRSAGGGGFGDALSHDPEAIKRDVDAGYITVEGARRDYGVVFDAEGEVDAAGTQRTRANIRGERCLLKVLAPEAAGFEEYDEGRRWVVVPPADAARYGLVDGGPMEIVLDVGAPLRAWTRISDRVPAGHIWLGRTGCDMLDLSAGDEVWLRNLPVGAAEYRAARAAAGAA